MSYLTRALASGKIEHLNEDGTLTLTKGSGPTPAQLADMVRLDEDEQCLNPLHREGCSCVADAAATDPRQGRVVEADRHEGPVPYVPSPQRGTHTHLTDFWMCWNDPRPSLEIAPWSKKAPQGAPPIPISRNPQHWVPVGSKMRMSPHEFAN